MSDSLAMDTNGDLLTTSALAQRWGISRQRVHQRAQAHPEILRPQQPYGPRITLWARTDVERFEREVLRPGGAQV